MSSLRNDIRSGGYSVPTGLVYIFNLIVGTGALTLPAAFSQGGWVIGIVILITIAIMSFITATFIVEAMSAANALQNWKQLQRVKKTSVTSNDVSDSVTESEPEAELIPSDKVPVSLSDYFSLDTKFELGQMADIFFNKWGRNLFYISICVYLYGDLAIYGTAISKSLRDVFCSLNHSNSSEFHLNDTTPCIVIGTTVFTSINVYRLLLGAVILLIGPFVFCNVQKTKYLQIATTLFRWTAFSLMIALAFDRLSTGKPRGTPQPIDIKGIPVIFGSAVYSFMCHHSIPSLITPISDKSKLRLMLGCDYVLILLFYLLLSLSGVFAFPHVEDLYTLNFQPEPGSPWYMEGIQYFLSFFPVFTLSASYPIIAITLKNNMMSLFYGNRSPPGVFKKRFLFPLCAIVPPFLISFITEDIQILVEITGTYGGALIQYVVPAGLVYFSRKAVLIIIGFGAKNPYASPFRHLIWIFIVLVWGVLATIIITVKHIMTWCC